MKMPTTNLHDCEMITRQYLEMDDKMAGDR